MLTKDGVQLIVEAAFSAATGLYGAWDAAVWGSSSWGPDIIWSDISGYVREINTDRHFSRDLDAWEAGTASVRLANQDGRFSPDNLSGPYVTAGVTGIRPWRPIRIRAVWAGITYPLYQGYVTNWTEEYSAAGRWAEATASCEDERAKLSAIDGIEQIPQGAGELSGARMHRILNAAGSTVPRDIDAGRNTMQATTLAANTVTEMQLTTDSEGGSWYVDADGTILFRDQYDLLESTRSNTIQQTYGDTAGEPIRYASVVPETNGSLIINVAAMARVGGTQQIAADPASRALYGDRRWSRDDLVAESDPLVASLAAWLVARRREPEPRIATVELHPRDAPGVMYPEVLGRRVRDLTRVIRRPPGSFTITRDCHVSGIAHSITGDTWSTILSFSSATPYTPYATSLWDTGKWDSAVFFH